MTITATGVEPNGAFAAGVVSFLRLACSRLFQATSGGAFTGRRLQHQHLLRRLGGPLQVAGGVVLLVMGAAMITGHIGLFAIWMLRALPWLGQLG
ncbi:hypothetical protein FN976_28150 [Caenimonas sedimenti]|uniref:Uncharacterized protein n=1 Tax=Caenimonas sedimenti TaxID=2596921 RepID=A0A562ZEB0_9BURK|nr:hypothetical protein [Caenimonas sedimenti]TWO64412.1 hypothetical protein FN976_28150 [Caenimonas sedimenti]